MNKNRQSGQSKVIAAVIGVLIFIGILFINPFRFIQAGTVGVVTRWGRVTGRVLRPGAHLIIPIAEGTTVLKTKKITYETAVEEKQKGSQADYNDYPVDTNTSDGQPVDIAYTIRFSVDPKKAAWVVQNIGNESDLVEKVVKTESRIWARNVPRRYTAEILYTGKGSEQVQQDIEAELRTVFKENGVLLDRVGVREIYFDEEYVQAIKQKQVEEVKVETAQNIAKRAEKEKEAAITKAEGEAKAQQLQQQTLTDRLLRKLWIEKWRGDIPQYVGDGGNLFFQIPTE